MSGLLCPIHTGKLPTPKSYDRVEIMEAFFKSFIGEYLSGASDVPPKVFLARDGPLISG